MELNATTTRADLSAACRSWEQSWIGGPEFDAAEEAHPSPDGVLAVLSGESCEDDEGRDYLALDETGLLTVCLREMAGDFHARAELLALIARHRPDCPSAWAILQKYVNRI